MTADLAAGSRRAGGPLAARGVTKTFPQGRATVTVLRDIDLDVPAGSFVTLFGPSGCGKSTLLRVLAGLQNPDQGEVSLSGLSPRQAARDKEIAWIPQSSAVLPWRTARGNARLAMTVNRAADRRRTDRHASAAEQVSDADEVLARLGLGPYGDYWPRQLSGGMKQRVAIARGFIQGASVMLMDEPFSALDEFTRERAHRALLEIWERDRRTVVMVTHSASEAVLLSDHVVIMTARPGRIHSVVPVELPRPRDRQVEDTPEFAALVARIKAELRAGGAE
jgi:NitT/TauT family transport system ATP-binding protein